MSEHKNKNHSFYKEQQKSILGQQQWTPKRIGKIFWKIFKWFLWGFLIIATLWGCVNEFIIQTSKNLGQGVEFYQKDDFVYPNTYQAMNVTGYTASKDVVEQGILKDDSENEVLPFNFKVVNSNFKNEDAVEGTNVDDYYINAADSTSNLMYTYNLNSYSVLSTGMLTYSTNEIISETSGYGDAWYVPTTYLPSSIYKDASSDGYNIYNTQSFLFYLVDTNEGSTESDNLISLEEINNLGLGDYISFIDDEAEEGSFSNVKFNGNARIKDPSTITTTSYFYDTSNWEIINPFSALVIKDEDTLDEKIDKLNNQIKYQINKVAFNNGTLYAKYDDLENIFLNDGETSLKQEFENKINELDVMSEIDAIDYEADFRIIQPEDSIVYGGVETFVVPIQKGFPIRIDETGQEKINNEFRKKEFQNWMNEEGAENAVHNDAGFDAENQMYGWTILDANSASKENDYQASIMRVYDSAENAAKSVDVYDGMNENNAFYADQRRLGWGIEGEDSTTNGMIVEGVESSYSVFDEKIKTWMNYNNSLEDDLDDNVYIKMSGSSVVGAETVSYSYGSEFAGITSAEQLTKSDENYVGVVPSIENGFERSILSDSVIPTGQDAWGESRITFIGWEDWGKAWDVQYGPLYGAFVFPLAQVSMIIGEWFHYLISPWGVIFSIIVIVFLTRGLGALLSIGGTSNQMKMQEVQTDVAKIKAKYSKYDLKAEPRMKQKQQQEIMALYRKKEINPMGSLGTIFITMPIFISLWIIISALPAYKVVFMGQFTWAVSSWYGVFNLGWMFFLYLLIGISVGLVQGVSSKLPTWLSNKRKGIKRLDDATKEASKKQNRTQNIMIGVFVFMGLTVPALFAFYWICSGFFTIVLELSKHSWKVHVAKQMKIDSNYQSPMARFKQKIKISKK